MTWEEYRLKQAARGFVTQLLRHLAGGSSWYELVNSFKKLDEAMTVDGASWKDLGDVLTAVWHIDPPEYVDGSHDDIQYWLDSSVKPALRMAASHFAHNPIQTHRARQDLLDCFYNIERIRDQNRRRR